ncbi:MAG: T9SS type A sorting domain-containing protein [Saprospiraceae bacterium]|nr:T9SS type A sorting domain-containing protein [Saprospiraceae bacterium]
MRNKSLFAIFLLFQGMSFGQGFTLGGRYSIALCKDSTIRVWGFNGFGVLGLGHDMEQSSGMQINGLHKVAGMAGGLFHALYVTSEGTVWSVGRNVNGSLGDGSNVEKRSPVKVQGIDSIKSCSGGGEHSLFLKNNGRVYSCGLNSSGQLGDGFNANRNVPVLVNGITDIIQVAAGAEYSLLLKSDGTVWACGHNGYGQFGNATNTSSKVPVKIPGLENIVQISCGEWHSIFVKNDGTVYSAGRNNYGQLGIGNTTDNNKVTLIIGLTDIIQADAGGIHSVFVKRDGTAWTCGLNSNGNNDGQLGDGTKVDKHSPVQVINSWGNLKVKYAESTREHTLFELEDGTIWGCGRNNYGQIGTGKSTIANFLTPVRSMPNCQIISNENDFSNNESRIKVYPNPSSEKITIDSDLILQNATLRIFDHLGRNVNEFTGFYGTRYDCMINELFAGIYWIQFIQNEKHIGTVKFIVQ